MKIKSVISLTNYYYVACLLMLPFSLHPFKGRTAIIPRSYTDNASLSLAGWQEHINDYNVGRNYFSFYLAPVYKRSFHNSQLADFLIGEQNCFAVQGSRVADRSKDAILADYFGLAQDFKSTVCLNPLITSFIFDMQCYLGLDRWCPGLYIRFHVPIGHTKWDLDLCEHVEQEGTLGYPAGYMGAESVPRKQLSCDFIEAMTGRACNHLNQQKPLTYGDMQDPLAFGLIQGRRDESRLSDVQLVVGYNTLNGPTYHAGLNAIISFPAGNRPNPKYFFAPIIGNGHHWGLGLGFTSHKIFWQSADKLDFMGFWLDTNIMHLFADEQCRSYDFCGNPASRYMLLSVIAPIDDANVFIDGAPIERQYQRRLLPAINVTTLRSKISMKAQVDLVVKWCLQYNGIQYDLGYNFWYRSPEKLHKRSCLASGYGYKGDAQLYGFVSVAAGDFVVNQPLALNVTQHEATLRGGQGAGNFVAGVEFANENADNPALATDSNGNLLNQLNAADSASLMIPQQQISASNGPILVTDGMIDASSALNPKALSHKIFGNIGYTWEQPNVCVAPFLNLGVEVEWRCNRSQDNSAISQWGIWAKGGLSY